MDYPAGTVTDRDRTFFERELNSFVPERIFDAHVHLYRLRFFSEEGPALARTFPEMTMRTALRLLEGLTPARETDGLFFGFPHRSVDYEANNRFVAEEVKSRQRSRIQMLVVPTMTAEYIREQVQRNHFAGLKCYHVFAPLTASFEAYIPEYLPEEQVRIAHEERLSITLHMVRARAMADPHNQQVLSSWARKYPNARFLLAHAARGFNPYHTIEGIGALKGLRNVWCDTSAVTEAGAFEAIVRTLGVDRLLYGSDLPVSHERGRCVAVGDSFLWLSPQNTDFRAAYGNIQPALVGHESLRILKLACWNLRLSDTEVEQIFYRNAAELFDLPR